MMEEEAKTKIERERTHNSLGALNAAAKSIRHDDTQLGNAIPTPARQTTYGVRTSGILPDAQSFAAALSFGFIPSVHF